MCTCVGIPGRLVGCDGGLQKVVFGEEGERVKRDEEGGEK